MGDGVGASGSVEFFETDGWMTAAASGLYKRFSEVLYWNDPARPGIATGKKIDSTAAEACVRYRLVLSR